MTDIKVENKAFYWATIFLRSLIKAGLKHIVISPGSRSTPLTMAAAVLPQLKKHVILDERSAAFFALGVGKATNNPAALICTSGTAVANYYPAVIEARMSGVPLLLLTADRPPHLRHTGANQTINQLNIFGKYPVLFHDVSEPEIKESNFEKLSRLAGQAVQQSKTKQGPVHLNFPFSKPLEPENDFIKHISEENKNQNTSPPISKNLQQGFQLDDDLLYKMHATDKPLVIIGQLTPATKLKSIYRLAESLHAPVLSEQGTANLNLPIQGFEGFLHNNDTKNDLEPDLILRFGRQPASKSLLQAIEHWQPNRHIYFSDSEGLSDINNTTSDFVKWNGNYFDTNKFPEKSGKWLQKWKETEEKYFDESTKVLADTSALTDAHIYHHLSPIIPEDWSIFISNSFPARDQSMFGRWKTQHIFTNRGASGIDGITSTAMGTVAGLNQPGILFTGDLAFLHDTNALLNAIELSKPLVIAVINNQGGSIFRMLPIAKQEDHFSTYFETPQNVSINKLAEAYDANYTLVTKTGKLNEISMSSFSEPGLHIIECKTDPDASMRLREKLWNLKL
jgi:2-succinyl-5-enolpyruvyl-6-hydroxy-3-cyclohexene-1-carboxylate synthase